MILKLPLLLLLLCLSVRGEELYHPRQLSESELLQTYTTLLLDACHHADRHWTNASFDPAVGYWGNGISEGNEGIRTIGGMALACGTLLKYDHALSDSERVGLRDKLTAALHYAVATHMTGTQNCADGKRWGGTNKPRNKRWQTGMWTGTLAFGAWLAWDQLDSGLRQDLERVIVSESDMLLQDQPSVQLSLDTKAEENGWNVPCLVLSEIMFPSHPHAAAWHEQALAYMMNTLSTAQDLQDTQLVDGRAVNQWVKGANLQPDFTLENHNIFHPAYVGCSSYFLTQAALYYTYAHRPIPPAATHHLLDTWRMFQGVLLPWGESAFPQGMDWELHGLGFINLYASLATHQRDPFAARLESRSLQYMRAWQLMCNGDLAVPGSRLGITRHSICAEQAAYGLLAHKIYGPATKELTARQTLSQAKGVRDYPYVGFIVDRTENKFVSLSWKNRLMGMIIPLGSTHDGQPLFTVPITDGLIGSFELTPRGEVKTTVVEHSWKKISKGFETTGILLLNGGRLKQTLQLTSLGDKTVVFQDRVVAVSDITVTQERGMPLGIENDLVSGGTRVVSHQEGEMIFDWQKPQAPFALPGAWVNVDGRLGVVMVAGAGMTYVQASGYKPGISVYADVLYNSYSTHPQQFKAGQEVAHRVAVFYMETTPRETSALAKSVKIASKPGGRVLQFKLAGGGKAEIPLL
jgi:hypothetical protein